MKSVYSFAIAYITSGKLDTIMYVVNIALISIKILYSKGVQMNLPLTSPCLFPCFFSCHSSASRTSQPAGGSPQSGTTMGSPSRSADWYATSPGRLNLAAVHIFVGESFPVYTALQKSSTMNLCVPPCPWSEKASNSAGSFLVFCLIKLKLISPVFCFCKRIKYRL